MKLPNGTYRTKAGSTVEISGKYGGVAKVTFDWFEEDNACPDCDVYPYPQWQGGERWDLTWACEVCDGGFAEIEPVKERESDHADDKRAV